MSATISRYQVVYSEGRGTWYILDVDKNLATGPYAAESTAQAWADHFNAKRTNQTNEAETAAENDMLASGFSDETDW